MAGALYGMDRSDLDQEWLYGPSVAGAFFGVRAKSGLEFRRLNPAVEKSTGRRCAQTPPQAGIVIGDRLAAIAAHDDFPWPKPAPAALRAA